MPYSITEARPAKTHPPGENRTWEKNRAREKFAYQIPSQALELQQEKPPTPTKLVLGVCVYHFGHDLIAIDQRKTALSDWEQHFYSYDGLGSVRALTDSAGQQTDTYTYDAFGIQLATTGATENAYRYTGEQFDEDLGQYYLRARYNDPNTGRFWSMDRFEGGKAEPLSLHKYIYGHTNPISNVDPTGFSIFSAIASVTLRAFKPFSPGLIVARAATGFALGHQNVALAVRYALIPARIIRQSIVPSVRRIDPRIASLLENAADQLHRSGTQTALTGTAQPLISQIGLSSLILPAISLHRLSKKLDSLESVLPIISSLCGSDFFPDTELDRPRFLVSAYFHQVNAPLLFNEIAFATESITSGNSNRAQEHCQNAYNVIRPFAK